MILNQIFSMRIKVITKSMFLKKSQLFSYTRVILLCHQETWNKVCLWFCSFDSDISPESKVSSLPESEESKEHDKQVWGSESLVNTLEQQLQPTEVHYGAEIPCLQGSLQTIHGLSALTRYPSVCCGSSISISREVILRVKNISWFEK